MKLGRTLPGLSAPRFALLSLALLVCLSAPRIAGQDTSQAGEWTGEARETIWKQQVEDAVESLGVTGKDKSELAALYLARRKALQEKFDALGNSGQGGQTTFEEYRRLVENERGNFKTALSDFLDEEQVEPVASSLGSFSRQWDRLLFAWREMGLDPEKSKQGRQMIAAYIVDWEKLRSASPANDDIESLRDELDRLKVGLDLSLATLLNDEQQSQWQRTTQSGARRQRVPGRRPR